MFITTDRISLYILQDVKFINLLYCSRNLAIISKKKINAGNRAAWRLQRARYVGRQV